MMSQEKICHPYIVKKTHNFVAISHNFQHQTFAKDLPHLMMLVAAACWLLLLAEKTETPKGLALTSRSCVNSGENNGPASFFCDVRRNNGRNVNAGGDTVLPRREVDRRVLAGELDQVFGRIPCNGTPFDHSAKH